MSEKNRSIAEKTAELEKMLSWFDSDEFVLEEAIDEFEKARQLADEITQDLTAMKNQIEIVKKDFSQDGA